MYRHFHTQDIISEKITTIFSETKSATGGYTGVSQKYNIIIKELNMKLQLVLCVHRQFERLKRNSKTLRHMSRSSDLKDMNKYTVNQMWKFDPCKPYLCKPPLWKLPHYCPSYIESPELHVHTLTGTQSKFCDIFEFCHFVGRHIYLRVRVLDARHEALFCVSFQGPRFRH